MSRIIVSLTSYPARIKKIFNVLDSIMAQTYKPDKVVLYLAREQFAGKKLPVDLSGYIAGGLEIHWCQDDMKSHKKYLYAFREYPNDCIITIDDDFYYEKHMIEELVYYMDKFPGCVLARRTHLITAESDGSISPYETWWGECQHYIGVPRMDLLATTGGGALYAPHLIETEVFNTNNIRKYCMYADDIWLKVMELISGVPVVQVPTRLLDRSDTVFSQNGLYQRYNGNGGNDRQFQAVLEVYDNMDESELTLTKKLFSTGTVYREEAFKKQKEDNFNMIQEWLNRVCQGGDIVIYGAGTVAKRIYGLLKTYKADDKIRCFAVEDISKNASAIEGINVIQYKEADYVNTVCIIALANLGDQCRVKEKLLELGLSEDAIMLISSRLNWALLNLEKA